jgi:hypothetical protein
MDLPLVPEGFEVSASAAPEDALPELLSPEEEVMVNNEFLEAMRKSYDPLTKTARDLRIEDEDFKLAKNVYDFCANTLGKNTKMPFARQFWIMYHLNAEYCPRCTDPRLESIENVDVDDDPHEIAERAVMLNYGVCPKCGTTKGEMVLKGELNDYNQLVAVLGQRSGKSMISGLESAYQVHRMLKIPRLSTLCRGIQEFTPLTFTMVALSFGRAVKLLWQPFSALLENSDWFKDYHGMLRSSGKRHGVQLLTDNKVYLHYAHKNIEAYPLGPLKRALRGDSRYSASCDEIGWFPYEIKAEDDNGDEADEREIANADEVIQSLEASLSTVRLETYALYKKGFHHIPTGLMLATSSPQSWRDKICRMLLESEGSSQSLAIRLPTWDVNPVFTRDHPYIVEQYRKNAARAERDFGANPPSLASERYAKETILPLFKAKNHVKVEQVFTETKHTYGRIPLNDDTIRWAPTVLCLDAGMVDNSFAFALGNLRHSNSNSLLPLIKKDPDVEAPTLEVKAIGEIIPKDGYSVSFPLTYKYLITRLIKHCNVVAVVADRWNSVHLLQSVETDFPEQCIGFQYSLKKNDFTAFDAGFIHSGKVVLPEMEIEPEIVEGITDYKRALSGRPAAHLYLQFRTVMEARGTIIKGDGFTDDIYRSLVLLGTAVRLPKVVKAVEEARKKMKNYQGSGRSKVLLAGRSGLFDLNRN